MAARTGLQHPLQMTLPHRRAALLWPPVADCSETFISGSRCSQDGDSLKIKNQYLCYKTTGDISPTSSFPHSCCLLLPRVFCVMLGWSRLLVFHTAEKHEAYTAFYGRQTFWREAKHLRPGGLPPAVRSLILKKNKSYFYKPCYIQIICIARWAL